MRLDRRTEAFAFVRNVESEPLLRAEHLAYARFEAALGLKFFAILDLVFADGDRVLPLPFVVVDGSMVLERELSPFIWPSFMAKCDAAAIEEIERKLEPWLRSRHIARVENGTGERRFSEDSTFLALLERATSRGWAGAAPSANVLRDIAPHVYASRFALGSSIVTAGTGAVNGGAYLAVAHERVQVHVPDENEAADASRWFGLTTIDDARSVRCDLYIGPREFDPASATAILLADDCREGERRIDVARPLPTEVMVSFDLDDAGVSSSFCVRSLRKPARPSHISMPASTGGSSGNVALVVREDLLRVRDADSDVAVALAEMLRGEGFSADVVTPSHFQALRYDVIHVIGHRFAPLIVDQLALAQQASIPVVVSPYADDPKKEQALGTVTLRHLLQSSDDELTRGEYLHALASRRLRDDDAIDALDRASVAALFSAASVAYVTCTREEQQLREAFGFAGSALIVPALALNTNSREDSSWAVGYDDFALVTGAVGTEGNAYLIARAAARLGIPFVLCGDVLDAAYYPEVRTVLGRTGVWLPASTLTEGERRSLFARARVVLDVSWSGLGLHRLATAACSGAAIVGSASGYAGDVWGELAFIADPGSEDSIAVALGRAWLADEAHRRALIARTAPMADPLSFLVNTVQGYHQASQTLTVR